MRAKTGKTGKVGALYLILYSVGRFIIEFFRNDYRGNVGVVDISIHISAYLGNWYSNVFCERIALA